MITYHFERNFTIILFTISEIQSISTFKLPFQFRFGYQLYIASIFQNINEFESCNDDSCKFSET